MEFITYVFLSPLSDSFDTITTPLSDKDDEQEERDNAPNMQFYVGMFTGDSPEETLRDAMDYIKQLQRAEGINFDMIRKESLRRYTEGSWLTYSHDGKNNKVRVLPWAEYYKEMAKRYGG